MESANNSPSTPAAPIKVSIVYCASCGYEPQTLELTSALMYAFAHDLAAIELIPWHDGAFDVVVDGVLVHSMYEHGGFPATETIIEAVRARKEGSQRRRNPSPSRFGRGVGA